MNTSDPTGQGTPPPPSQSPRPLPGNQPTPANQPIPANRPVPVNQTPPTQPAQGIPVGQVAQPLPVDMNRPVAVTGNPLTVRDDIGEEYESDATHEAVKAAPPWLVSLVFHMIILIVLGLMVFKNSVDPGTHLSVVYSDNLGELDNEDEFDFSPVNETDLHEAIITPQDLPEVVDPLAAPPEVSFDIHAVNAASDVAAPTIGSMFDGRSPGMKAAYSAAFGGNKRTQAAVADGLMWLKRNQKRDGGWSMLGPYRGGVTTENRSAATAMALIAFQGDGSTHLKGEYSDVVRKGWKFLLAQQDKTGSFVPAGGDRHARFYTQAQCTIAICELYGMSQDSAYREPAQRALNYAFKTQSPKGGWRYDPRGDADTSVTGWFVMALQSGKMAGLKVPEESLLRISKFLDSVAINNGSQYLYRPGAHTNPAMTAEALLCRQYLGWKQDDPRLQAGIRYLQTKPLTYDDENVYYWYYATQTLHHDDSEAWESWNRTMKNIVPQHQTRTGNEKGSWAPENDSWGIKGGGRLFTTCLSIYMLEVYYRHLPIYSNIHNKETQLLGP